MLQDMYLTFVCTNNCYKTPHISNYTSADDLASALAQLSSLEVRSNYGCLQYA